MHSSCGEFAAGWWGNVCRTFGLSPQSLGLFNALCRKLLFVHALYAACPPSSTYAFYSSRSVNFQLSPLSTGLIKTSTKECII